MLLAPFQPSTEILKAVATCMLKSLDEKLWSLPTRGLWQFFGLGFFFVLYFLKKKIRTAVSLVLQTELQNSSSTAQMDSWTEE